MKKQQGFFWFFKDRYKRTMKFYPDSAKGFLEILTETKKNRTFFVIIHYLFTLIFIPIIFFLPGKLSIRIICALLFFILLEHLAFRRRCSIIHYLFLYLFYFKKINNDKYSINEQVICKKYLFDKTPENFLPIVNKYYIVTESHAFRSEAIFWLVIRKRGLRNREAVLQITGKAIYFNGEKIFDKLYDLFALDNYLKASLNVVKNSTKKPTTIEIKSCDDVFGWIFLSLSLLISASFGIYFFITKDTGGAIIFCLISIIFIFLIALLIYTTYLIKKIK